MQMTKYLQQLRADRTVGRNEICCWYQSALTLFAMVVVAAHQPTQLSDKVAVSGLPSGYVHMGQAWLQASLISNKLYDTKIQLPQPQICTIIRSAVCVLKLLLKVLLFAWLKLPQLKEICLEAVQWMNSGCTVAVQLMCSGCAVDAQSMCSGCAVNVQWMRS